MFDLEHITYSGEGGSVWINIYSARIAIRRDFSSDIFFIYLRISIRDLHSVILYKDAVIEDEIVWHLMV